MSDAIRFENVSKSYRLYSERNQTLKQRVLRRKRAEFSEVHALDDVSFSVRKGATVGLVGANGAGKSTALKLIAGILPPDEGTVTTSGRVAALLELATGFHPELSGRENVFLYSALMGLAKSEVLRKFDGIVEFSGLGQAVDRPVKTYSSGMYARLGFSVAMSVEPEVLLLDEVLAVGDEEFQRRCSERILELQRQGITIVLVSHGLGQLNALCTDGLWIQNGTVASNGPIETVVRNYLNSLEAGIEHDEFGRIRSGPGPARVSSVILQTGDSGESISQGSSARFEIHVETGGTPVADAQLNIEWIRADGLLVASSSSPTFVVSDRGRTVLFDVPQIPLGLSDYELSTTVTVNGLLSDQLLHACRMTVVPGRLLSRNRAPTELLGSWKV